MNQEYRVIDTSFDVVDPETILLNKENRIDHDLSKKQADLVIAPGLEKVYMINRETYIHFLELKQFLLDKFGIEIYLGGVYRTIDYQKKLYDRIRLVKEEQYKEDFAALALEHGEEYALEKIGNPFEKAKEYADAIVAVPGSSEHHTGLAIDLEVSINGHVLSLRNDKIFHKYYYIKIAQYFEQFGFILRYPKGSEEITGYPYEPWHIRYVGKRVAMYMKENNIDTFEEYIESKSKVKTL